MPEFNALSAVPVHSAAIVHVVRDVREADLGALALTAPR
jgi:hypothetical protein